MRSKWRGCTNVGAFFLHLVVPVEKRVYDEGIKLVVGAGFLHIAIEVVDDLHL
jgi:hypothetical protein